MARRGTVDAGVAGGLLWASTAIIPLVFAATRWTWALGFAVGIDPHLLAAARARGDAGAGAVLGTVAICGAALTLGLVRIGPHSSPN